MADAVPAARAIIIAIEDFIILDLSTKLIFWFITWTLSRKKTCGVCGTYTILISILLEGQYQMYVWRFLQRSNITTTTQIIIINHHATIFALPYFSAAAHASSNLEISLPEPCALASLPPVLIAPPQCLQTSLTHSIALRPFF